MIQLTLTLKMTTAGVVEPSVTVNNSPIQDYDHPNDYASPTIVIIALYYHCYDLFVCLFFFLC